MPEVFNILIQSLHRHLKRHWERHLKVWSREENKLEVNYPTKLRRLSIKSMEMTMSKHLLKGNRKNRVMKNFLKNKSKKLNKNK